MFEHRTTFVIGAGASCELGLPSGDALMAQITTLLKPSLKNAYGFAEDGFTRQVQRKIPFPAGDELNKVKGAQHTILKALPWSQSIDNLLHVHQANDPVRALGKAAIAYLILQAEAASYFFPVIRQQSDGFPGDGGRFGSVNPDIDREELRNSWYRPFAKILFTQVVWEELPSALQKISFVIFNYDRCFEQFIYLAIQDHYSVSPEMAAEVLKSTEFLHPYGTLGPLPWQTSDRVFLPLGANVMSLDCFEVGERLKTFTESVETQISTRVQSAVAGAESLVFLGFGFLKQNIELLQPLRPSASRIYATTFGLSLPNSKEASNILTGFMDSSIKPSLEMGKCSDLFENYRMSLSA